MSLILNNMHETHRVQKDTINSSLREMKRVVEEIVSCFKHRGKLMICGNGGSAADSQHMAAEFVGRFFKERIALPAIALTTDTSALTALGNDYGFDRVFSRQVEALGNYGDLLLGISTSGKSTNVIEAFKTAKQAGITTISLTGKDGGELKKVSTININVQSHSTARIQEAHLFIYHTICEIVEMEMLHEQSIYNS